MLYCPLFLNRNVHTALQELRSAVNAAYIYGVGEISGSRLDSV